MIKKILLAALLFSTLATTAQVHTRVVGDSVRIHNNTGTAELILENSTKNVDGFLYNKGEGRTEFRRPLVKINDSIYLIGSDTLKITAGSSADAWKLLGNAGTDPSENFLGTIDSSKLVIKTFNQPRAYIGADGTINLGYSDTASRPGFRLYPNGDFLASAPNNNYSSSAVPYKNGIRYHSRLGYLEVGTSNIIDTSVSNMYDEFQTSGLIVNTDSRNKIYGQLGGSVISAYNVNLAANNGIYSSMLTGGSFFLGKSLAHVVGGGVYHTISDDVNGSLIMGNSQWIFKKDNNGGWFGFNNRNNARSMNSITAGHVNNVGSVNQLTVGGYLVNRSYSGIALGNVNVDFTSLPYNDFDSILGSNVQNIEGRYLLFSLGNSQSKNATIRSNALSVLYNGRTQINTTGFNNSLTESDVTPKAAFEVVSNNSGVLLPRLSTGQRDSIAGSDLHNGLLLFNNENSKFQYYTGSGWRTLCDSCTSGGGSSDVIYEPTINSYRGITSRSPGNFGIAIGDSAGNDNTSFYSFLKKDNNFIGYYSGFSNITGGRNNFFGSNAGYSNLGGSQNSFFGHYAGYSTNNGTQNVFVGSEAGYSNTTGFTNNFIGATAGYSNTDGESNNFFGYSAGTSNTSGGNNVFMGQETGISNTTGSRNIFVGTQAGYGNTVGNNNVLIGYRAGFTETGSNKLYIESSNSSSPLIYGDFAADSLKVNGSISIRDVAAITDTTGFKSMLWNPITKQVKSGPLSGGGSASLSYLNGLTKLGTDVKLGGALVENSSIDGGSNYNLTINGNYSSSTAVAVLSVTNQWTGAGSSGVIQGNSQGHGVGVVGQSSTWYGVQGNSTNGNGVHGQSTNGSGLSGSSTSGYGVNAISTSSLAGYFVANPSSTNTIVPVVQLSRQSTGLAANNIGLGVDLSNETTDGIGWMSNRIVSKWLDANSGTRTSEFSVVGVNNASSASIFTLHGNGKTTLNKYGTGSNSGTSAYDLQVDASGNLIETPVPLSGSTIFDFPSTNGGSSSDLTVSVSGAADGDVVSLGVPNASTNPNSYYTAWVSSANTVTVRFNNYSGAAIDPTQGTFKIKVLK